MSPLPFAALPHALAADPRLTPVDVRVLAALLFWARDRASCWPCDRSIAARVGRSTPTVQRALRKLQGLGVIGRDKVEPSDANRTGRVIRLRWRSAPRSSMIAPPRSPVIDEGIENEREKERPASDEGTGSPPPPAGEADGDAPPSAEEVARFRAWAAGPDPVKARFGRAALRLAGVAEGGVPCPAPIEAPPAGPISTQDPRETPGIPGSAAAHDIPISTQAHGGAATQVREPLAPQAVDHATGQVRGGGGPTMGKPLSQHLGCVGVAHMLGDVIKWPLNHARAGPAPPRRPASP